MNIAAQDLNFYLGLNVNHLQQHVLERLSAFEELPFPLIFPKHYQDLYQDNPKAKLFFSLSPGEWLKDFQELMGYDPTYEGFSLYALLGYEKNGTLYSRKIGTKQIFSINLLSLTSSISQIEQFPINDRLIWGSILGYISAKLNLF